MTNDPPKARLYRVDSFREFSDLREEQEVRPSIREYLCETPQENEEKTLAYLRSGHCVMTRGHLDPDVLDPSAHASLNPSIITDSIFAWDGRLIYYVEKYHVRLPPAFLRHMALRQWEAPKKLPFSSAAVEFI